MCSIYVTKLVSLKNNKHTIMKDKEKKPKPVKPIEDGTVTTQSEPGLPHPPNTPIKP